MLDMLLGPCAKKTVYATAYSCQPGRVLTSRRHVTYNKIVTSFELAQQLADALVAKFLPVITALGEHLGIHTMNPANH
ncbi:hypothetical protein PTI98_001953 [Pleurotus ostreatus]|nr:hypothetical protein PTI98_001953 [Pleurotus ostreatus]